jgi:hypothetical protein
MVWGGGNVCHQKGTLRGAEPALAVGLEMRIRPIGVRTHVQSLLLAGSLPPGGSQSCVLSDYPLTAIDRPGIVQKYIDIQSAPTYVGSCEALPAEAPSPQLQLAGQGHRAPSGSPVHFQRSSTRATRDAHRQGGLEEGQKMLLEQPAHLSRGTRQASLGRARDRMLDLQGDLYGHGGFHSEPLHLLGHDISSAMARADRPPAPRAQRGDAHRTSA